MQPKSHAKFQMTKRFQTLLFATCCVVVLYVLFGTRHATVPDLPPMPGTYQYFLEKDFHTESHLFGGTSHCDPRFAPMEALSIDETRRSLMGLLDSYVTTMERLGAETWIAHGVLLGWYWNRKLLPWDTDLDVQMAYRDLAKLAQNHNMSEYSHTSSDRKKTIRYLLDINPHSSIISTRDVANKIDARWIDTTTGKFIDITAVHPDPNTHSASVIRPLWCKDGHRYSEVDIYPLKDSILNGKNVKIPAAPEKVLREEYGKSALTNRRYHWHRFNPKTKEWEPE